MNDVGRLHVHLGEELKQKLKVLHNHHGDISLIVRTLVNLYLEGRLMPIDPMINQYLDTGDDAKVIELLTQHLVNLRALRVQARSAAAAEKTHKTMSKGLQEAGVQTAAQKMVDHMLNALKGGMPTMKGGDTNG